LDDAPALIGRAQHGDRAAFAQLVSRHRDAAYRCALATLKDAHLAQDATQDAFAEAFRGLAKLARPEAFAAWLRRIVVRCCNRISRRKRLPTAPVAEADHVPSRDADPAILAERREMRNTVLAAVEALPQPHREITELYYIEGHTQAEVAACLGLPVTTVNNRLHASRAHLRDALLASDTVPLTPMRSTKMSDDTTPKGWSLVGSAPNAYQASVDTTGGRNGGPCARLDLVGDPESGFGTLMQSFRADRYQGTRLRMSAYAKSRDVEQWAGLWMRVDGRRGSRPLAFDNMSERPIKGTSDWAQYATVLDVPEESSLIAFGALLRGAGQIWVGDFAFEEVDESVPVTRGHWHDQIPDEPSNLGFDC